MRALRRVLLGAVFAVVLAGCGEDGPGVSAQNPDGGPDAPAEAPAGSVGTEIDIENFRYDPMRLEVKPGQKITVTNLDAAAHTLTAKDGSIDSGDLGKGERYDFTAPDSGTVAYLCDLHQYMTGEIVVG